MVAVYCTIVQDCYTGESQQFVGKLIYMNSLLISLVSTYDWPNKQKSNKIQFSSLCIGCMIIWAALSEPCGRRQRPELSVSTGCNSAFHHNLIISRWSPAAVFFCLTGLMVDKIQGNRTAGPCGLLETSLWEKGTQEAEAVLWTNLSPSGFPFFKTFKNKPLGVCLNSHLVWF